MEFVYVDSLSVYIGMPFRVGVGFPTELGAFVSRVHLLIIDGKKFAVERADYRGSPYFQFMLG